MQPNQLPSLALFDLDHTLLDGDSNCLWVSFLEKNQYLDDARLLEQQAEFKAQYDAQQLDINVYLQFHACILQSAPLSAWLSRRAQFIQKEILPRISGQGVQVAQQYQNSQIQTAIVSATNDFLVQGIAEYLKMPAIASPLERQAQDFTGKNVEPACFQQHKITHVKRWLQACGIDDSVLSHAVFYSDSYNDLPLLQAVQTPVAVNPCPRLQEYANTHSWQTLHWTAS